MNIAEIRDEALKLLGANCILALYDCCSEAFNEIDRLEKENAEYKEVNEEWETFNISKRRAATVEQRTQDACTNLIQKEIENHLQSYETETGWHRGYIKGPRNIKQAINSVEVKTDK